MIIKWNIWRGEVPTWSGAEMTFLPILLLSWLEFQLSDENTKCPNESFIFPGRFNENVKGNLFIIRIVFSKVNCDIWDSR